MSQEEALQRPASMLERELSQDTLMAIKAIVSEDQADPTVQDATLKIPARARRSARGSDQMNPAQAAPRVRKVQGNSGASDTRPRTEKRRSVFTKYTPSLSGISKVLTPRRLAIAVIIGVVFLEPWFIPTVLLGLAFLISFVLLALGPDRVKHFGELGWKRFAKRKPEKAAQLRRRATDRFERLQKRLDKLPSSWTRGLHMPQMSSDTEQTAAETAYKRRMAEMAQEERQQSYS